MPIFQDSPFEEDGKVIGSALSYPVVTNSGTEFVVSVELQYSKAVACLVDMLLGKRA